MNRIQAARILGLSAKATRDEIRQAWRRAVLQHHPDRGGDQEKLMEAKRAAEVLLRGQGSDGCKGEGEDLEAWLDQVADAILENPSGISDLVEIFAGKEAAGRVALLATGLAFARRAVKKRKGG